jgi:threonine dehydratase
MSAVAQPCNQRRPGAAYSPAVPDDEIVTPERINAARQAIAGSIHRTPLLASTVAARVVEAASGVRPAGGCVYLKAEHLQKTGSFKPRGMVTKVLALSEEDRRRGIITFSAGNAAQAYAFAGAAAGVPVTVVMPAAANRTKVAATLGYGAEVILEGTNFAETFAAMERIRDERGLTLCHPFDDVDVIAGHASVGLEIAEDLPDVDVVVVPIGGGGLIAGTAAGVRQLRPQARIYGVEPTESNAMRLALDAGAPVPLIPRSVADGLNAPFGGVLTTAMVRALVEDVVLVDDAVILSGLRFALERTKQVLEPAGAAGLAALLTGRIPVRAGETVCVVFSGGNVDMTRLGELLATAVPLEVA